MASALMSSVRAFSFWSKYFLRPEDFGGDVMFEEKRFWSMGSMVILLERLGGGYWWFEVGEYN
jgi:hypothetical protein